MSVVTAALIVVVAIALFAVNSAPKIAYQPASACDLFSPAKAKELLGNKALNSSMNSPVILKNTASSKCGYTDGNPDTNNMIVAAIIVRSGINDAGIQQNKTEFTSGKPTKNVEIVNGLGDNAYFNEELGQLNILSGHEWIILSFGVGSAPGTNTVDKSIELAHKVLR